MTAVFIPFTSRTGFFAASWRKTQFTVALLILVILPFFLIFSSASSSCADDKPPQEEYENALMDSYTKTFAGADVSEAQVSSFVSCLSEATYDDLSAETIQALTSGNLDYDVSGEEADIFLGDVQTCLADNNLSDLVVPSEGEGDGGTKASAGETEDVSKPSEDSTESSTYLLPLATALTLLALIVLALYLLMRGKSQEAHEDKKKGKSK